MTSQSKQEELPDILLEFVRTNQFVDSWEPTAEDIKDGVKAVMEAINSEVSKVLDELEAQAKKSFDYEKDAEEYAEEAINAIQAKKKEYMG